MKKMNRVFLLILAVILMVSCSSQVAGIRKPADSKSAEMAKIRANYLISLQHPNLGVVESAMMNIVKMKLLYPNENCSRIQQEINQLTTLGKNERIRYKAFLTAVCLQNPNCISEEIDFYTISDDSVFYNLISSEIANYLANYKISHTQKF